MRIVGGDFITLRGAAVEDSILAPTFDTRELEVDAAFARFTDSGADSTDRAAVVGGTGVGTSGATDDSTASRISRGNVSASSMPLAVVVGVAGCLAVLRGFVLSRGTDVGGALDGARV
jgi:hypothetical protein